VDEKEHESYVEWPMETGEQLALDFFFIGTIIIVLYRRMPMEFYSGLN